MEPVGQRLVGQQGPAEIELPLHRNAQLPLDVLRQDLAEHELLGEILRAHDDVRLPGAGREQREAQAGDNFRSIHSNPSSARSAMTAAGTAPASTVRVSAMAMPRKMKTPSPPPPIAAAMVAVPIAVTVAIRSPATIDGTASGQFHLPENLPRGHTHRDGRLADRRVHPQDTGQRIPQHGQERVQAQAR